MRDERAGDGGALFFAARKLGGVVVHAVLKADGGDGLLRAFFPLRFRHVGVEEGELHVLQDRGAREQVERLEHEAHLLVPDVRAFVVGVFHHLLAVEEVRAARVAVQKSEDMEQGGLAGARRAHDGDKFTFVDGERYILQRDGLHAFACVDPAERTCLNDGRHGFCCLVTAAAARGAYRFRRYRRALLSCRRCRGCRCAPRAPPWNPCRDAGARTSCRRDR